MWLLGIGGACCQLIHAGAHGWDAQKFMIKVSRLLTCGEQVSKCKGVQGFLLNLRSWSFQFQWEGKSVSSVAYGSPQLTQDLHLFTRKQYITSRGGHHRREL